MDESHLGLLLALRHRHSLSLSLSLLLGLLLGLLLNARLGIDDGLLTGHARGGRKARRRPGACGIDIGGTNCYRRAEARDGCGRRSTRSR